MTSASSSYPQQSNLDVGTTAAPDAERCPYRLMIGGVLGVRCGKVIHADSEHGVVLEGPGGDHLAGTITWTDDRG